MQELGSTVKYCPVCEKRTRFIMVQVRLFVFWFCTEHQLKDPLKEDW